MQSFIVKCDNIENLKLKYIIANKIIPVNSFILFLLKTDAKIYGLYKIVKFKKIENNYKLYFESVKIFRRGIELLKLKQFFNIKIPSEKSILRLNQKYYETIITQLEKINYPQLASDIVSIKINKNLLINYIKTYPEINIIQIERKLNLKMINQFLNISRDELKEDLKKYGLKIYEALFLNEFLKNISNDRDIAFLLDEKISFLPLEISFDGYNFLIEKYNISRVFKIENYSSIYTNFSNYENTISLVVPKYYNENFEYKKIFKIFSEKFKNLTVYSIKLSEREFVKILENSKILYFAGHSVFNKRKNNYALKFGENKLFFLDDFLNAVKLPELIIFHSCFDNRYLKFAEKSIKNFFVKGTKNIILPAYEILKDNSIFITEFVKNLLNNKIGEAFRISVLNSMKINNYEWIYFRLFGDPKIKYF